MKDFEIFKNYVLSQGVEISDKTNVYQCMDLAYAFCLFLHVPKDTVRHLYAYQIFTSPNDITNEYFQIIPNDDSFIPQEGDIGVFNKTNSNIAGHVCICTGNGNTKTFKSLDQNWAGQSKVSEVTHDYINFLGVLRPKIKSNEINEQTLLPIIDANGNLMEVQAVRSELADNERQITNLLTEKDNLLRQVDDLKITVSALNSKITSLENEISTLEDEVPTENIPSPCICQKIFGLIKKLLGI